MGCEGCAMHFHNPSFFSEIPPGTGQLLYQTVVKYSLLCKECVKIRTKNKAILLTSCKMLIA